MSHEYPIPPAPETSTHEIKHTWLHGHPYRFAALGALACTMIVVLIVSARSGVPGSPAGANWVNARGIFFTRDANRTQLEGMTAAEILRLRATDTPLPTLMPPKSETEDGEEFGNDLSKLLAQLTKGTTEVPKEGEATESAFSFIPQGIISIAAGTKARAPLQESLFTYGNEVGTYIQGFESGHGNSAQLFKDHVEDRKNPQKAAAVGKIGFDYASLGRDLLDMQSVPQKAKAMHDAYATGFRILGTNLDALSKTTTDEDFLRAIETYNKSVESLAKRYLELVALFSANNVTFSASDPGSIFMFNPTFSF